MKEVKAHIRVLEVDAVVRALEQIGAPRLTAIDVRALGHEVDGEEFHVSMEHGTTYTTMVKIEVICADSDVSKIVDTILLMNIRGRDPVGFVREASRAVAQKVQLPPGASSPGAAATKTTWKPASGSKFLSRLPC
jgi:nitrogen regulatory protein PII